MNAADSRVELVFDLANPGAFTAGQTDRARRRLCHRLNEGVLVVAVSEHRFLTGARLQPCLKRGQACTGRNTRTGSRCG